MSLESICAFPSSSTDHSRVTVRTSVYDKRFARETHYATDELIHEAIYVAAAFIAKQRFKRFNRHEVIAPLFALNGAILSYASQLADIEARWTSRSWHELFYSSLPKASQTIQWFCNAAPMAYDHFESLPNVPGVEYREDVIGIVAAITPWNDPLVAFAWKVVPALIAGNSVIWKPSEHCLETACWVVSQLHAFGLPKERLQLVLGGPEVGNALVRGAIQALTFTGSSSTARHIVTAANKTKLVKMHIEAGGKGCAIIGINESDASMMHFATTICNAAFSNQGQICSAPTLVFCPKNNVNRFTALLQAAAVSYAPADPTDHSSRIGGLISVKKKQDLQTLLSREAEQSIRLTHSLDNCHGLDPTLVINPLLNSCIVDQELFGPIVSILPYEDLDVAIDFINQQDYGLANGLFSHNPKIQRKFIDSTMGGILHVNSWGTDPIGVPFGGTKNSGFGKEKSLETLRFYTTLKPICSMS